MNLDKLLTQYDNGSLSRRDLLGALALLVAAPSASAAATATQGAAKPIGAIAAMNHVSIFVPDVKKSMEFYQGLFGMPLLTRQDPGMNLSCGSGFLGIYPNQPNATGGSINHVCLAMENFDADAVLKQLTGRGIKANASAAIRRSSTSPILMAFACNCRTSSTSAALVCWGTSRRNNTQCASSPRPST